MTGDPRYLLDANVFSEAAKGYYAFDIAPRFWEALIANATDGRVISIDRVNAELNRGKDELKDWANGSFHQWFESTDADDVIQAYGRIMAWAAGQTQFSDAAKAEFANISNADAWIVACALARGHVVVTHERFNR